MNEGGRFLCPRWLRFQLSKDPLLKLDNLELLAEFGRREGYSVAELDARFREEEAIAAAEEAAARLRQKL